VDDLTPTQVTIKARLKTITGEQANVGREYRRRLKKAFDQQRIDLSAPPQAVTVVAPSGLTGQTGK